MKVCIYGAGAIGGLLGARFAASSGFDVSVVARGATLATLREHGLRVRSAHGALQAPVRAVADARELGVQDLVVVAVKATSLLPSRPCSHR